jgi:hypothetical protein
MVETIASLKLTASSKAASLSAAPMFCTMSATVWQGPHWPLKIGQISVSKLTVALLAGSSLAGGVAAGGVAAGGVAAGGVAAGGVATGVDAGGVATGVVAGGVEAVGPATPPRASAISASRSSTSVSSMEPLQAQSSARPRLQIPPLLPARPNACGPLLCETIRFALITWS